MTWYAIYETATGRLVSVGTVIALELASDLTALALVGKPDDGTMWDEAGLSFVPRPQPVLIDRLQDIITDPDYADMKALWKKLTPAKRMIIRDALSRLLGSLRWRDSSVPVALDEGVEP